MIRAKDAGSADEYGIVLARFTDLAGHYSLMMPRTTRIATGHRFCIFYLGGYMVRVKVDKRPMPSEVDPFLMRTNAPLYVVLDDSRNRREFAGVARLVVEAEKLRGCPPRH
jgi:adenosine/AMP kinase